MNNNLNKIEGESSPFYVFFSNNYLTRGVNKDGRF